MRRYDLDWLRIAAFGLLIGYHVGMLYVPWSFHVKSEYSGGPALTALMLLSNPWRLSLLFVISGAATAFMAQGLGRGALAWQRVKRLLIPLVFGMAVVVVPQVYFEVTEAGRYSGGFITFWGRYLRGDQSFRTPIPTWNHLWFVAYLLVYTLIVVALAPRPRTTTAAPTEPSRAAVVALLLGPWFVLWVLRMTLFPLFGSNHAMLRDWYDHTLYFGMFLFGFTLAVWLKPLQLGGALEGALVVGGTAIACVATAEVARRSAWLRPLFGFRPAPGLVSRPSPQTA
jgi:glucans biosynthesis protein C